MTQSAKCRQFLLSKGFITIRDAEVTLDINSPSKAIKQALNGLLVRECQDINHNTGATYKIWRLK